jgi:2-oxoacid:acceptor oxidoreductase gamma subunit (pyruvate/2-ketoisovalerate family)
MIEIRFHSRGGQGAVIAAKILAVAFFKEGKFVQTFPSFGSEVRGAPVMAYTRVDDKQIQRRWNIYNPDYLIILDESLLKMSPTLGGLKDTGWIVLNTTRGPAQIVEQVARRFSVATVDATHIAFKHGLGSRTMPIVNTAILGGFAKVVSSIRVESIEETIRELVPINTAKNISALWEAFESTNISRGISR